MGWATRSSTIFKRMMLQSKIPGSCTYALNDSVTILRTVEGDNRRRSQKHRTTSLSGCEQSHDHNQSRGSAHNIFLNLKIELRKTIRCEALPNILSISSDEFYKFDNTSNECNILFII